MVFSATFALPLAWSLAVGDGAHRGFVLSALACLAAGGAIWLLTYRFRRELEPRDGPLLVVLGWIVMACAAMVPLSLEIPQLSFTDAFFEAVAGLTTTGSTTLSGLDALPQSVNLWRHALQWYGGLGIIVMAIAILPMLGVGGMQLYKAEMAGPMKESKLTPRITQTAKYLWLIYIGLTAACIGSLKLAGMSWFDAVCHGLSTLALGGYSNRDGSVGDFDSPLIEAVMIAFMLCAVLSFTMHFRAWRARSPLVYLADAESRAVLSVLLGSGLMLAVYLYFQGVYDGFDVALRHAMFAAVSIGTSAGYMGVDYAAWPVFAPMWLLLLACIASSAGSTGGGIKMVRTLILLRQAARELRRLVHSRAVAPLTLNGQVVENRIIFAVLGYMLLWGATQTILAFALMASGLDFESAFSSVVASVNNLGPAYGRFGPSSNFSALSDFQTWLLAIAMIAGRLELLTFFVVLTPSFWRR
ncbi:MAG: TrkH family potassium uptake protein [Limnobacter sp.]|nr:TrkH family potassium uptake protein [Limnobacter sp.]